LGLEWQEIADLGNVVPSQPVSVKSDHATYTRNPKDFPPDRLNPSFVTLGLRVGAKHS